MFIALGTAHGNALENLIKNPTVLQIYLVEYNKLLGDEEFKDEDLQRVFLNEKHHQHLRQLKFMIQKLGSFMTILLIRYQIFTWSNSTLTNVSLLLNKLFKFAAK